ncbi:GTP-binding protein ypt3 [Lingula anatina]|uniref:GTP-binding protein ypt3 n=1 Tax=Lingula anatina TaxID=7574 RepID=A0A1S3KCZ5_LINAN|nr:GTP-binding protein ypt3 [Lingula anatina]|eukprot:XP_013420367.1 GTP-binding protein ypt3 [Lingula anatina]
MASARNTSTKTTTNTAIHNLRRNRTFLIQHLNIEHVVELLLQESKIGRQEYDEVCDRSLTGKQKVKALLDVLDRKDDSAYEVFRRGIVDGECDQKFIVQKLDETEETVVTTKYVGRPKGNDYKVILLGESGVGKTNLQIVYTEGRFPGTTQPLTIGTEFSFKDVEIDDNSFVRVQIWDTAGQETYAPISRAIYRDCDGVIFVYDVTRRESLDKLAFWIREYRQYNKQHDRTIMMMVGNKRDLLVREGYAREVTPHDAHVFAEEHGIDHVYLHETSAATKQNVNTVFRILINEIYNRNPKPLRRLREQGITLSKGDLKKKKSKCPCLRGEKD